MIGFLRINTTQRKKCSIFSRTCLCLKLFTFLLDKGILLCPGEKWTIWGTDMSGRKLNIFLTLRCTYSEVTYHPCALNTPLLSQTEESRPRNDREDLTWRNRRLPSPTRINSSILQSVCQSVSQSVRYFIVCGTVPQNATSCLLLFLCRHS